jgi:REP element-mobilizing transposase RayT
VARPLRIEYEGAIYHVTGRGNEQRKIFFSRRDYEKFKEYIAEGLDKYGFILHGYVLMTNHYHLIIETPEKNLSKIMHHINSSYTTYTNIKRKRSGHLLQGRFKSIVIDKDSYLLELSRYLHLNPVRAKMAQLPGDYPYSSYGSYTTAAGDKLVTTTTILNMLAPKPDAAREKYRSFVESALNEGVESPFKKVYAGIILGSVDFIKEVLGKIELQRLENEETSHRRSLRASLLPEEVVSTTYSHYGLSPEEISNTDRNDIRKKCIYLLKKHTSAGNREIGEILGGMGPGTVAKAYQRFVKELADDARLKQELRELQAGMSHVKG